MTFDEEAATTLAALYGFVDWLKNDGTHVHILLDRHELRHYARSYVAAMCHRTSAMAPLAATTSEDTKPPTIVEETAG